MMNKRTVCTGILWLLFVHISTGLLAQNSTAFPPLEWKHQQRIVFLGNSFFENEISHGYIELALSSRWPDADLVFRNLGWTGDNVFAEARSTFTKPPTAYQQLFMQLRSTNPDYVFIAYGGIESQKGEEGLEEFTRGLEVIIDSVDALGAETILLSTIPVERAGNEENTRVQNRNLKTYADAIRNIAQKRKKRFLDLFQPLTDHMAGKYAENGIHLNANGYYFVANVIEKELKWPERSEKIGIDARQQTAIEGVNTISFDQKKIQFTSREKLLPLPATTEGYQEEISSVNIRITGLKKGIYTLTENGKQLHTASASDWAKGITLNQGVSVIQAEKIREFITKKNDLFFQQYRPLNRTYILGFRAYEQGRHKQGLQDLDFIITWLEGQINVLRKPTTKTYELIPVK